MILVAEALTVSENHSATDALDISGVIALRRLLIHSCSDAGCSYGVDLLFDMEMGLCQFLFTRTRQHLRPNAIESVAH